MHTHMHVAGQDPLIHYLQHPYWQQLGVPVWWVVQDLRACIFIRLFLSVYFYPFIFIRLFHPVSFIRLFIISYVSRLTDNHTRINITIYASPNYCEPIILHYLYRKQKYENEYLQYITSMGLPNEPKIWCLQ